ncbi:LytTR family transcriptional regulator [Chryseobacterium sp. G0240]|uniref:LytTR family DNA-binding domain-containing protein n=1 Tax=Chryseobacterium sp. G0240 TaxID=2487066 RepID=UPI000F453DFD|nr:LytTR family DNA-binding domain-containing protein [Chryseobacterium sp. G0240]ROI02112.1 LytTR family transcriptional regulator [Chryseobacterium sp. G0240]
MVTLFSFSLYPYPKSESVKEILFSSLAAGVGVYLFLITLQPFGTESFHHPYKYLLLFPYSIIFGSAFFTANLVALLWNNWNIGLELFKVSIALILGSALSYFYNSLCISHVELSLDNYFYMLLYSLAIGIPVAAIYILSRYIYLKNTHEHLARDISRQLIDKKTETCHKQLIISAGNTKIIINESDFLCAQSMENYCSIYFSEDGMIKKHLLRISLSSLLQQIETSGIKKCHRSYIVNLKKVNDLKGNAQGYKLILPKIDFEIPVSRSFIHQIIPLLQEQKG